VKDFQCVYFKAIILIISDAGMALEQLFFPRDAGMLST
jgi:hypothetical protein